LLTEIAALSGATVTSLELKRHSQFFDDYFRDLGARTLLVESPYIDRDYLEDFAAHYVKCFDPPKRNCGRIHVFARSIGDDELSSSLRDAATQSPLSAGDYLGFIVVKPLALAPIGRTCLRTYSTDGTGRHFPAGRSYSASILGQDLEIPNTLAFQEQDSEVAACASSALWASFQATGVKFNHAVPTPVEITRAAAARLSPQNSQGLPGRSFPAHDGLGIEQMADCIRYFGLEPYAVSVDMTHLLQAQFYAYLRCGIPSILVLALGDTSRVQDIARDEVESVRLHAIAVTGYHLVDGPARELGHYGIYLRAARIDKIYAHDDGVGPHSMIQLSAGRFVLNATQIDRATNRPTQHDVLRGSWGADVVGFPLALLAPIYPKMRIDFDIAFDYALACDQMCIQLAAQGVTNLPRFEWDIFITTVNELKRELAGQPQLSGDCRKQLLEQSYPRFIWRLVARRAGGDESFEILLDATGQQNGNLIIAIISYAADIANLRQAITHTVFGNVPPVTQYIFDHLNSAVN
jgi:hypothetical protein